LGREEPCDLALAVHEGRAGALERLVRTYQDPLYGYARQLLGNAHDAEEVAQDAFLRAHRALTLRYDAARCRNLALRPWLYRIARNLACNRRRARRVLAVESLGPAVSDAVAFPAGAARHRPAEGSEHDSLWLALARLKPAAREAVVLRFVEELPYADVAAVLGVTEAAARGKVFRALKDLKRLFRK
jgi:RNA polymerase sigma-70 factor, ECF subfamily